MSQLEVGFFYYYPITIQLILIEILHSAGCPCAFGSNIPQFKQFISDVNAGVEKLVNGRRYNTKQFAVVIQPFFSRQVNTPLKA
jgi:hypothetical protein